MADVRSPPSKKAPIHTAAAPQRAARRSERREHRGPMGRRSPVARTARMLAKLRGGALIEPTPTPSPPSQPPPTLRLYRLPAGARPDVLRSRRHRRRSAFDGCRGGNGAPCALGREKRGGEPQVKKPARSAVNAVHVNVVRLRSTKARVHAVVYLDRRPATTARTTPARVDAGASKRLRPKSTQTEHAASFESCRDGDAARGSMMASSRSSSIAPTCDRGGLRR